MDKETLKENIEYCLYNVSPLAAVALLFGYTILSALNALPSFFSTNTLLFSYGTTVTLFFLGLGHKVETNIKVVENGKIDTKELILDIKELTKDIKSGILDTSKNFELLNNTLTERCKEDAKIYVINSADELYEKLGEAVKHAKDIRIMHLDPFSPNYYKSPSRTEYFKIIFDYVKLHNDVTMKRITSLNEVEKIEWLRGIIKETRNVEKLDIAYIDIPNLEDSFLNTLVSCQVLDGNKTFLLNPMGNTVPAGGTHGECLYIESEVFAKVYEKYFDRLWDIAVRKHGNSRIIKSGRTYLEDELNKIEASLREENN